MLRSSVGRFGEGCGCRWTVGSPSRLGPDCSILFDFGGGVRVCDLTRFHILVALFFFYRRGGD